MDQPDEKLITIKPLEEKEVIKETGKHVKAVKAVRKKTAKKTDETHVMTDKRKQALLKARLAKAEKKKLKQKELKQKELKQKKHKDELFKPIDDNPPETTAPGNDFMNRLGALESSILKVTQQMDKLLKAGVYDNKDNKQAKQTIPRTDPSLNGADFNKPAPSYVRVRNGGSNVDRVEDDNYVEPHPAPVNLTYRTDPFYF